MHLKFFVEISDLENPIFYSSGTERAHVIFGAVGLHRRVLGARVLWLAGVLIGGGAACLDTSLSELDVLFYIGKSVPILLVDMPGYQKSCFNSSLQAPQVSCRLC